MPKPRTCRHRTAIHVTTHTGWDQSALSAPRHPEHNAHLDAWCPDCGALAAWNEDQTTRRWIKPARSK